MLVSLQSHTEVLNTLDAAPAVDLHWLRDEANGVPNGYHTVPPDGKILVASISPQVRASIAATYGVSEREAGFMIDQFLSGPQGLKAGGQHGNSFTWVVDTNVMREACLMLGVDEVTDSFTTSTQSQASAGEGAASTQPNKPILTSACPGWICYAEKTHPHVLPHLSRLKSPQALTGTIVKTVLSRKLGVPPSRIWHVAAMPCFDKKLEASREELTDTYWGEDPSVAQGIRDVDCVITARELIMLADTRGISFPSLPKKPLRSVDRIPFPDPTIDAFLFQRRSSKASSSHTAQTSEAGPSGGYLYHILRSYQRQHPGSEIRTTRGRNADVLEYALVAPPRQNMNGENPATESEQVVLKAARYYGFRNIQNLVRKLKPAKASRMPGAATRRPAGARGGARAPASAAGGRDATEYAYVEVMACPGGCTNGGGQIKVEDVMAHKAEDSGDSVEKETNGEFGLVGGENARRKAGVQEQKEWLAKIDEAYFSASNSPSSDESENEDHDSIPTATPDSDIQMHDAPTSTDTKETYDANDTNTDEIIDGINHTLLRRNLHYWAQSTGLDLDKLVHTSFRKVESDVGKDKNGVGDTDRVVELAGRIGGGW